MNDMDTLRYVGFGSNTIAHHQDIIENTSFETFLSILIRDLKTELSIASANLKPLMNSDPIAQEISDLLAYVSLFKTHLEFTLAIWRTNTEEEVLSVKDKFDIVKNSYQKINSKEDLAVLPAKIALATFHDKLILDLDDVLKKCFKKVKKGKKRLFNNPTNLGLIKILIGRFKVAALQYPLVVTMKKDDIMNYPKSSPIWQDIYKSAAFTSTTTREEVLEEFKFLYFASNLSHIFIHAQTQAKGMPKCKALWSLISEIFYYGTQQTKAQIKALLYLIDPQAEEAFMAWNMINSPLATIYIKMRIPFLGYDKQIFLPRLFPRITKDVILQEYQEETINKILPLDPNIIKTPKLNGSKEEILRELFIPSEDKVAVRILAPDHLHLDGVKVSTMKGVFQKATNAITGLCAKRHKPTNNDGTVVIHMHGGGFVAMSSASMRVYTARWCEKLKMVHFSIDHRLAPKHPYPDAIDDIWQAYLWIINYSESILGIKAKKVIFAGDSSGANLAIAIILRIIHAGLEPPQGCLLVYPCLKLDLLYYTPSCYYALDNPMLHLSLLRLCIKAYVTEGMDYHKDPYISPIEASDEILAKMPSVRIITGSEDPFQDDNWRMVQRLRKLKRDIKIDVHEHLSHAFMCHQDLKNFNLYIDESCRLIKEIADTEPLA